MKGFSCGISCDTRWQRLVSFGAKHPCSALEPTDERFMGEIGHGDAKFGLHARGDTHGEDPSAVTMSSLRKAWGV